MELALETLHLLLLLLFVTIKGKLLKFNMFNICKINISKLVLVFFPNFKIVDLK